jgi:hypothetical protein
VFADWRFMVVPRFLTVDMRATLQLAVAVTIALQVLCYAVDVPAGTSLVVSTAVGCAAYVVLRMRQAPEDEG